MDGPSVQMAAVVADERFREVAAFERHIAFDPATASVEALELIGYREDLWRDAVRIEDALPTLNAFLQPYRTIEMRGKKPPHRPYRVVATAGPNPRFDHERLRRAARIHDVFLSVHPRALDTSQLAAWLLPGLQDYKLGTVAAALDIKAGGHDALADARCSLAIAAKILGGLPVVVDAWSRPAAEVVS